MGEGRNGAMVSRNTNEDSSSSLSSSDESRESDSCDINSDNSHDNSTIDESSSEEESLLSSSASSSCFSSRVHSTRDGDRANNHRKTNGEDSDCLETKAVADFYSSGVRDWTEKVPIGMNLCPWAKLSQKEGRIRYVSCPESVTTPEKAAGVVWEEIDKLRGTPGSLPPWSTTLVICPHVEAWKTDFEAFEAFVKEFGTHRSEGSTDREIASTDNDDDDNDDDSLRAITLVPFHPRFVRWRGLPETIAAGSSVRCHRGLAGFSKSPEAHPATVVDPRPPGFGRRRIRVRFHGNPPRGGAGGRNGTAEQCVPVDWVVLESECGNTNNDSGGNNNINNDNTNSLQQRPPLPDNNMHRSPYPVVHILRNEDLVAPTIHEISRLKRRNARRMASEILS